MDKNWINKLAERLPKSPGLQARETYFNSAVFIPFIKIKNEYHILFEKRVSGIRQGDDICFPGGGVDPALDHNFQETALRELHEELGVHLEQVTIIGILDTMFAPMGAIVDAVVGIIHVDDVSEFNIAKEEVSEIFTLPFSYFFEHHAQEYSVRVEVQPSYQDENGEEVILLPVQELGLPERYLKPWGKRKHKVYVYKTQEGVIWGLTAELIRALVRQIK